VIERINPSSLAKPSGFTHAVGTQGGRIVWLAGQTAMDASGAIVGVGDIVAQFDRVLANLMIALRAAGGEPGHLVQATIYIVDVLDYRAHARDLGAVWRNHCGTDYPATAGIGVARLWDADALVEVAGVAVVPD
jgi:enamine deaminase RidA (YjgF/YER057c/UK114 family)